MIKINNNYYKKINKLGLIFNFIIFNIFLI